MARIVSTAVALPENRVTQKEARDACARHHRDRPRLLALLELFREGAVGFEQVTPLGELTVRWTGDGDDTDDFQIDEFDGVPEAAPAAEETPTDD